MKIKVQEPARDDLIRGYWLYENQDSGLGDYFLDTLSSEIDSLLLYAGIHPIRDGFHRMLARKFPFSIYYRIEGELIKVYSVLDNRSDPSWNKLKLLNIQKKYSNRVARGI